MESRTSDSFIPVGDILRSHGLSGEMVVVPGIENPEFLEKVALFYVKSERGDLIPMRIEYSKVIVKNKKFTFFVKFENITDKNGVDELKNRTLFVSKEDYVFPDQNDEESVYDLIDFELVSEDGNIYGMIVDVIDNPAHPILEITGQNGHFMVPYVGEYIIGYDKQKHRVIGKNIEQLMNI